MTNSQIKKTRKNRKNVAKFLIAANAILISINLGLGNSPIFGIIGIVAGFLYWLMS